jgi:hypothetical protein
MEEEERPYKLVREQKVLELQRGKEGRKLNALEILRSRWRIRRDAKLAKTCHDFALCRLRAKTIDNPQSAKA